MKRMNLFLIIVCSLILIDRIVKEIVLANLTNTITLIPNFLSVTLVFNNGVAFGLFENFPYVIEAFTGLIILFSLYALPRIPANYVKPMAVIIGGAAGNFVDRIVYNQGVIDFISVKLFSVFNIADVAISLGVFWAVILLYLDDRSHKRNLKKKSKKA